MSVWGHETVYIVKHSDRKCWEVFTPKLPRQLLVTIPWADAIKDINHAHAPDYVEAIAACRQSAATDLTAEEEAELLKPPATPKTPVKPGTSPPVPDAKPDAKPAERAPERTNVLSMADFRKRKKR